ncbi:MAG TPA: alpha/beta fold hydrolase [Solirubrobacteraceae bacterium]|jgi:medium-chain acyl-[acyl-carrier-protein] hydrolase|nr:alpha/beta fold hydrolase [Solirubrobacteraceae bacterium]
MAEVELATAAWLPLTGRPSAIAQVFCMPHAGGGTTSFQGWEAYLPAQIALVPVRAPGRELRFTEPPFAHITPLVQALQAAIVSALDRPYVLLGHSLGALIAFELARTLRRSDAPSPLGLIVSGYPAPQLPRERLAAHRLPDAALKHVLCELGGVADEVLANDELLSLFLPLLRADLAVDESYEYESQTPLEVPIVAFAGEDDRVAHPADVACWREQTSSAFRMHLLAGGHFSCYEEAPRFLRLVEMHVSHWLRTEGGNAGVA